MVQLDAWNWEDAAYKMDAGIHLTMPSFIQRFGRRGGGFPGGFPGFGGAPVDPAKQALDRVEQIKTSSVRQKLIYKKAAMPIPT